MRYSLKLFIPLLFCSFAAAAPALAQEAFPRLTSVEPTSGKAGTEIVVTGENTGKDVVAKLYLTTGKIDIELTMAEQTATSIKTTIPASVKPGVSYKLMVLTRGKEPKLIEQPVRFEIEE